MKRRQNIRASHTDTRAGQRRRVASRRTASSVPGRSTKPSGILIITSHKPVSGQSINVDSSVATRAFIGTNPENAANFCIARQNEAARAADAAACIDTSLGTVLLKNGWGRR
jgi:hypothetical protein